MTSITSDRLLITMHFGNLLRVAALAVTLSGCASGPTGSPSMGTGFSDKPSAAGAARPAPTTANQQQVPAVEGLPPAVGTSTAYLIGPGDLLSVKVFKVAELSTEERVNEGGAIVLPLVGAVPVAGLTPEQAGARIAEFLAADYMNDPQVNVFIKEYANMNVTVGGAVKKPGVFPITGAMTLLQAVARAEGPTDVANKHDVIIFRGPPGQSVTAYVVDLKKVQRGEWPDPLLVSNDKVMVPESGSAVLLRDVTGTLRGFISAPLYW